MPTDADLINLLPGLLRQAALAKARRPGVIDAAEQQQVGGAPMPAAPAASAAMPTMSQSQFTQGLPLTPEQQAQRQAALMQALRNRTGGQ